MCGSHSMVTKDECLRNEGSLSVENFCSSLLDRPKPCQQNRVILKNRIKNRNKQIRRKADIQISFA